MNNEHYKRTVEYKCYCNQFTSLIETNAYEFVANVCEITCCVTSSCDEKRTKFKIISN